MRKVSFVFAILLIAACAGRLPTPSLPHPHPDLLEGEARYLRGNDIDAAEASLLKTLRDGPDARAAFLLGDLYDETGRPQQASAYYFKAISAALQLGESGAAAVAAAIGTVAIRDRVEGFYERFLGFMNQLRDQPGRLPPEAWYQLANLKYGLLRNRGETARAEDARTSIGCLTTWQTAGPFGPWVWEGFDAERHELLDARPWPSSVALGPGRGDGDVREVTADTCFVTVDNPQTPQIGVTYARTTLVREKPGPVWLRLYTGDAVSVRVGGKEVIRRDTRERYLSSVIWKALSLPKGRTEILVKLASVSATPSFSLVVMTEDGTPGYTEAGPELSASLDTAMPVLSEAGTRASEATGGAAAGTNELIADTYAKMKAAIWWDDMDAARRLADQIEGKAKASSAIMNVNRAEIVAADPALPGNLAYEQARPFLEEALSLEPRLWQARVGLAYRELDEDRMVQAVAMLEEGLTHSPEEVSIPRKLAETFVSYGWYVETEESVKRIEMLMPTSCNTYAWRLALARQRSRFDEARKLASQITDCDAFSTSVLQELKRAGQYSGAISEAKRLAGMSPESVSARLEVAAAEEAVGDNAAALAATRKALELTPLDGDIRLSAADGMNIEENREEALSLLQQAFTMPLAPKPVILEAVAALKEEPLLKSHRIDGLSVIEAYRREGSGAAYDNAAVYVLDRAVYSVDEHGGIVMVIHMITHLKTDEAVEEHGELTVPEGARLLTARTIKADDRILEPEAVQGKYTLSMPELSPGDFVEAEYVLYSYPNQLFPGGFDTGRFFFQDFDTAFHRSEIVVIVPEGMPVAFDPRGRCPSLSENRRDGRRIMTWRTRNAAPFPSEPLSPEATEYLPSIRVTSGASWTDLFKRIGDQLADKDRQSHVIDDAVQEALQGISDPDPEHKRKAIFRWVMDRIVPLQGTLEEASHMIAERAGNRARAFAAMMQAAGLPARLVLVRSTEEDGTVGALPSLQLFTHLLVDVGDGRLIDFGSEYTPFGFLEAKFRNRPMRYVDTGELANTGVGVVERESQHIDMSLTLTAEGDATGRITETLTGALASGWRSGLEKNHDLEQKRIFQGAYLAAAIPGAVLKKLTIKGQKQPEDPLVLQYDVSIPDFARKRGERLRVSLPFTTKLGKKVGGLPSRESDLVMGIHIEKQVDATIVLPKGYTLVDDAVHKSAEKSKWGALTRYRRHSQGKIVYGYQAHVDVERVLPSEYQAFLEFAREVDELSDISLQIAKKK